jgi:5'-nucleotidase (lipoprotein e(P4) family)
MKYFANLFFLVMICSSCSQQSVQPVGEANPQTPYLVATKYFQNSAENAGLYHQAYNMAYAYVAKVMKNYKNRKKACVVLDIDETVLDNSFYQGSLYHSGKNYTPESWSEWVQLAQAPALPGSVEYIRKVRELGVEILLITNRSSELVEATIKNLEQVGVEIDPKYIVGKDKTHSKELRRSRFKNECQTIQLIGDNLSDFSDDFNSEDMEKRKKQVLDQASLFGTRYILLPNPMYGDWRKTILKNPLKGIDSIKK